ncbi:hypothetical protein [Fibrivirga algicola]|uniref:Uncharacterized protein n=1 Tax=Fibrivirga algicola TaxID=2950420 RepID=A0ABX0QEG2_9BACT|nr:hypothetical protein [Fibrivirga algicola]NID09362.1 hypothetical protein [Fibrivirga algicola]
MPPTLSALGQLWATILKLEVIYLYGFLSLLGAAYALGNDEVGLWRKCRAIVGGWVFGFLIASSVIKWQTLDIWSALLYAVGGLIGHLLADTFLDLLRYARANRLTVGFWIWSQFRDILIEQLNVILKRIGTKTTKPTDNES